MTQIHLTNDKGVTLVDDADVATVDGYRWSRKQSPHDHTAYAYTWINHKRVYLHMLLVPGVERVDHIDGDGLNNQRYNLRGCTHSENMRNTRPYRGKQFKGVCYRKRTQNWSAQIKPPGSKQWHLGVFESEEEAARAYDAAARAYFGEFARLNFPVEEYGLSEAASRASHPVASAILRNGVLLKQIDRSLRLGVPQELLERVQGKVLQRACRSGNIQETVA